MRMFEKYREAKKSLDELYSNMLLDNLVRDDYNEFLSKLENEVGLIGDLKNKYQPLFFEAYSKSESEKGLIFKIRFWYAKRKIKAENQKKGLL